LYQNNLSSHLITAGAELGTMANKENVYGQNDKMKNQDQLENAQEDQDRVGAASTDPETTGPAENLRDKAAKAEDKSEGSKDSV
jgi:hypothetical protein